MLERLAADLERAQSTEELHGCIRGYFAQPDQYYQACLLPRCLSVDVLDTCALALLARPTHPCHSLLAFKRQLDDKPAKENFSDVALPADEDIAQASGKLGQFPTFEKFSAMDGKQKKAEIDRFVQLARQLAELLKNKIAALIDAFLAKHRQVFADLAVLQDHLLYFRSKHAALRGRLQAFSDKTSRLRSLLRPLLREEDALFETLQYNRAVGEVSTLEATYMQFSLKQANALSVAAGDAVCEPAGGAKRCGAQAGGTGAAVHAGRAAAAADGVGQVWRKLIYGIL